MLCVCFKNNSLLSMLLSRYSQKNNQCGRGSIPNYNAVFHIHIDIYYE